MDNMFRIFVVDDEELVRQGIALALGGDFQVSAFETAEAALEGMRGDFPDLVLLDIGLPGMNGIEAIREIKALDADALIIMITAFEDINSVIAAMKAGAHDYMVKPLHMDALEIIIQNALETMRLKREVRALQERYLRENLPCFVGESSAIHEVMGLIERVAKSPDTPILILGETGTGKELIASAIHYRSPNFKGPLVTVNCAAIPKNLIETELFGYAKGAFSGALTSGKKGLVEEAINGTLFLDEVGDLSHETQAKLLRFLEDGEFYRVGATKKLHARTRIVSATNKDLKAMIEKGLFRRDLYFRLSVIKVQIPSLNERPDDIIPLAGYFLLELSQRFKKSFTGISPRAQRALLTYRWVGHVRELKNMIERGVLIGDGPKLEVEDLGIEDAAGAKEQDRNEHDLALPPLQPGGMDLDAAQEYFERYYIKQALRMTGGNESKAAKLLNLNHHTFRYRKKKQQIN